MCTFEARQPNLILVMKNMILASSSSVHGSTYLGYLQPALKILFKGVKEVLFVPYARPGGITHDAYTEIAQSGFDNLGLKIQGLHTFSDPKRAISEAEAIFVGGGNTFVLVDQLYEQGILSALQKAIENGTPYLGTSAGSNICGQTMQTTNDMPIVKPVSFETLGCIPFNINAHYIEPAVDSTHKGETRETRIKEFHVFHAAPVIGLREGSWLEVNADQIVLRGDLSAVLFCQDKEKLLCSPGTDIQTLV